GPVEGQRTDNKKKMGSNRGNRLETPARVPKWLDEVDEIIKNEGSENFSSNDLGCSDVKKKYRAERDAFKLTKDIKALIEESNKIIFDKMRVVEKEVRCRRVVEEEGGGGGGAVEEEGNEGGGWSRVKGEGDLLMVTCDNESESKGSAFIVTGLKYASNDR
ncbi:hypothetical protein Tco_1013206, partial [Tanacetum coccineum]